MDADLLMPLLPKVAATRVNVSKQYILQLFVAALRLTASQSVDYEKDEDGFLGTVQIHVPIHINIPQLTTTTFHGDYCQTMDAALESAGLAALVYMQNTNILLVDDFSFPQLQKCKNEAARARSWSDIFQHETLKLTTKINSLQKELAMVKEMNTIDM